MNNQNIRRGNPQEVVYKNCHSKFNLESHHVLLSKVRSRIKYGMTSLFNNNQEAGDPRQNSSGMTPLYDNNGYVEDAEQKPLSIHLFNTKAFTLIELLVVVLIIGILAAVALPQYQLAVVKARVSTILPIVKSMASANEMYYLEHGTYASREASETLDIDMPKGCVRQYQHNYWQCDTDYGIDFSNQVRIILHYCPNHNANYDTCTTSAEFALDKFYNHADTSSVASDVPGKWLCRPKTALGTKICSSLNLNYH